MSGQLVGSRGYRFDGSPGGILPGGTWADGRLVGCFLMNGSLANAVINRAFMQADGIMSPTPPAVGSSYLTFTAGTSWIDTDIVEPPECTIMAVARYGSSMVGSYLIASAYNGPSGFNSAVTSTGFSLYGNTSSYSLDVAHWTGSANNNISLGGNSGGADRWNCLLARFGAADSKLDNMGASSPTSVSSAQARNPTANTVRMGSSPTALGFTGQIDIASCLIWNAQITDAETQQVYAWLKAYEAGVGLTVA